MAENVAHLRKERGMSQSALASRMRDAGQAHWRQTTVSRVENGLQGVTLGECRALSAILGPEVTAGTDYDRSAQQMGQALFEWRIKDTRDRLREIVKDANTLLGELEDFITDEDNGEHPEAP